MRKGVLPLLVMLLVIGLASCGRGNPTPPSGGHVATGTTPAGGEPGGVATPTPDDPEGEADPPPPPPRPQLPRGGRSLFPQYRLVGYAGHQDAPSLGRLGIGDLDDRVDELIARGRDYRHGRQLMPVLELITIVVQASPGSDGMYRKRAPDELIRTYLDAARRHDAMLFLNVQPGQSDFLTEVKSLRRWIKEPDVGLALDPEWAMHPGQIPGRAYGWTTGDDLDAVSRYVSSIVEKYDLPEKPIVYHQVARSVVRDEDHLKKHPGVVMIKSVDGIGSRAQKTTTYNAVNESTPDFVHAGFKLFFEEDVEHGPLMTPKQVLALKPRPEYVMYE